MQRQFMDKGKTVVFDDVDNPYKVYELTEAATHVLGLLSSRFCWLPPLSNLQHTVALAFSDRCAVTTRGESPGDRGAQGFLKRQPRGSRQGSRRAQGALAQHAGYPRGGGLDAGCVKLGCPI